MATSTDKLDYRCKHCQKLLGVAKLDSELEIKCLRCGEYNIIAFPRTHLSDRDKKDLKLNKGRLEN